MTFYSQNLKQFQMMSFQRNGLKSKTDNEQVCKDIQA